jgi:peptide-methionine (R)-S-oxide reductase
VSDQADGACNEGHRSDDDWRSVLTPEQYRVLRQGGTEPPWSHPYNTEHRQGRYSCAGCGAPLFASDTKFDSGSGWPSYFGAFDDAIETAVDRSHGMVRVEMRCRRCGGHLGHIFDDGPTPTRKRYCTNGTSLKFEPEAASERQP